jgi:hypothetical protein
VSAPAGQPMVLVGTHHKTGTVWMKQVFEAVARECGQPFFLGEQRDLPPGTVVFFQEHSRFEPGRLGSPYRGLHLIRDPRDVVISAAHYHLSAHEPWLDRRRLRFFGRTYRQMLARRTTPADRIRFEMWHVSQRVIRAMAAWDDADPHFLTVKYEDLIQDTGLVLFRRIFGFLGYPEHKLERLCGIAREKSLFSGQVQPSTHVRSGAPGQWRAVFDRELAREFHARFGAALIRLGYEPDDGWCQ